MAWNFCLHSLLVFIISFTTIAACPENGNCEACNLTLSVSKESVNDVIRISPQDLIAFDQNFQQQPHSGFTFAVNDVVFNPNNRNSDFPCTEEANASSVTQTLHVRYHCIAVQPGNYGIKASVHYCGKDYQAQNQFTVIVENGNMSTLDLPTPSPSISLSTLLSIPSSTSSTVVLSTLNPLPTRSLQSSSTTMAIAPSDSSSRMLNSTNTPVSPPVTTENDSTDNIVIGVVTCAFTGLIFTGVVIIILLKCGKRRLKTVLCCWSEQPKPDPPGGDPMQQQMQYRCTSAVSEISNEDSGSYVAASDYPTPMESMSVSYVHPEQVIMSETVTVIEQPESATTPHQWGTNNYTN